jgi:hypothetical protein
MEEGVTVTCENDKLKEANKIINKMIGFCWVIFLLNINKYILTFWYKQPVKYKKIWIQKNKFKLKHENKKT